MEPQLRLSRRTDRIFASELQYVEHLRIAGSRCQPPQLLLACSADCRHDRPADHRTLLRRHVDPPGPPHPLHPRRIGHLDARPGAHAQLSAPAGLRPAGHGGLHPALHGPLVQRHDAALPGAGGRHARRFAEDAGLRRADLPDQSGRRHRSHPAAAHDADGRLGRNRPGPGAGAHRLLLLHRRGDPAAHGPRHRVPHPRIPARGVRPLQRHPQGGERRPASGLPHAAAQRTAGDGPSRHHAVLLLGGALPHVDLPQTRHHGRRHRPSGRCSPTAPRRHGSAC